MSWPTSTIGEVCLVVTGATPKTGTPDFWDGNIPWVTPKNLSDLQQKYLSDTPRKLTDAGFKSCSTNMLPAQSVLLSSRAPIGLVAINTIPVCTNQGFKSLVPRNGRVSSDYLYWWLVVHQEHLQWMGRGATFKEVSKKIVESIQIPLPPLAEQKRIAAILDAADALRTKRRESLDQLDTLLQSTFLEMFGDPVTNPMEWRIERLTDVCVKITDGTHHSPPTLDDGIPYITAKHLKKDGLKFFEKPWYVSSEHHAEIFARCDPQQGDVLYIKDGATTGIAAVNHYDFEFSMLSSLALLKPNTHVIHSVYLCAYLNNERNKSALTDRMGGAAIKRLTLTKIKTFEIPLPPLSLQHRFAAIVESIEQQKATQRQHLEELDTLFAALQQRAFNGELTA